MTARQVWGIMLLFVAGVALGYAIGSWYLAPRLHHAIVEVLSC